MKVAAAVLPLALGLLAQTACDTAPRPARGGAAPSDTAGGDAPARDRVAGGAAERPWVATAAGLGPVRAGMTAAEVRTAVGGALAAPDPTAGCAHVALPGAPGRALVMLVDGRVARVEVKDSAVATDRGARVGDSEARIDSLYGGRVRVEPHKYTDGHYLVVVPDAAADSAYRLIFETDGRRVLEYRTGLLPAVAWVEGCG